LTDEDLKRLVKIAHEDQRALFERNPHLAVYRYGLVSNRARPVLGASARYLLGEEPRYRRVLPVT
jgi:hypothetical protein